MNDFLFNMQVFQSGKNLNEIKPGQFFQKRFSYRYYIIKEVSILCIFKYYIGIELFFLWWSLYHARLFFSAAITLTFMARWTFSWLRTDIQFSFILAPVIFVMSLNSVFDKLDNVGMVNHLQYFDFLLERKL